jgi:hypothetical protein
VRNPASNRLKLTEHARPRPDARAEVVFRKAVAHEMLLARETARDRGFDPTDARWKVAVETQRSLQGTVLAFEDRRRVLKLANGLGIRAFDANLIVALVQDRARRDEPIERIASTLALLPVASAPPVRSAFSRGLAWACISAIATAIIGDTLLIIWLMFS